MEDPEQLVRVDAADHQVVVAVLLVVQVERSQATFLEQDRDDLLDVDGHGVMPGVDAHLRALTEVLADRQRLAPVLHVGVVEGRLVELVLEEHAGVVGEGRVHLGQGLDQAPAARPEVVLAGIVRPVGQPDLHDVGAGLLGQSRSSG